MNVVNMTIFCAFFQHIILNVCIPVKVLFPVEREFSAVGYHDKTSTPSNKSIYVHYFSTVHFTSNHKPVNKGQGLGDFTWLERSPAAAVL